MRFLNNYKSVTFLFIAWLVFAFGCSGPAYIRSNDLLVSEGKLEEAAENYNQMILNDSDNADLYYRLAKIRFLQQRLPEADKAVEKALILEPQVAEYRLLSGKVFFYEKEYQQAINQLRSTIALDSKRAEAYYYLGLSLRQVGKNQEALRQLKLALAIEPLYADAMIAEAKIRFQEAQESSVIPVLIVKVQDALKIQPTAVAGTLLLAEMQNSMGRSWQARETLENRLNEFGANQSIQLLLAKLYFQSGELNKAKSLLNREGMESPERDLLILKIERKEKPKKNLEKALEVYLEKYPNNIDVLLFSGEVKFRVGKNAEAEQLYQRVLRLAPNRWEAHVRLSELWLKQFDQKGALQSMKRAFKIAPANRSLQLAYLDLLTREGRFNDLAVLLNQLKPKANEPRLLFYQGVLAKEQGLYLKASQLFQQSQRGAFSTKIEIELTDLEIRQGLLQRAKKRVDQILLVEPDSLAGNLMLAKLLFYQKEFSKIPNLLQPYVDAYEGLGRVHRLLAKSYILSGDLDKGINWIQKGLELWPQNPELIRECVLYLGIAGKHREAILLLEDAVAFPTKYLELFQSQLILFHGFKNNQEEFQKLLHQFSSENVQSIR